MDKMKRISVFNAAKEKGCSYQTIYNIIKAGKLDTVQSEFGWLLVLKNKKYYEYIPDESKKRNVRGKPKNIPGNMDKNKVLEELLKNGVFAVIRMPDHEKLVKTVEALCNGGVKNIEITMTVPKAGEAITKLRKHFDKEVIIGAGTVATIENADEVIAAGAQFVVSPMLNLDVVAKCKNENIPVAPGCYTPTEIYSGWNAGADIVKVFPATTLGPGYFKDVLAPFPFLKLMPTGGVSIENVGEWVKAGAVAVALGGNLVDKAALAENKFEVITEKAKKLTDNFNEARAKLK